MERRLTSGLGPLSGPQIFLLTDCYGPVHGITENTGANFSVHTRVIFEIRAESYRVNLTLHLQLSARALDSRGDVASILLNHPLFADILAGYPYGDIPLPGDIGNLLSRGELRKRHWKNAQNRNVNRSPLHFNSLRHCPLLFQSVVFRSVEQLAFVRFRRFNHVDAGHIYL